MPIDADLDHLFPSLPGIEARRAINTIVTLALHEFNVCCRANWTIGACMALKWNQADSALITAFPFSLLGYLLA